MNAIIMWYVNYLYSLADWVQVHPKLTMASYAISVFGAVVVGIWAGGVAYTSIREHKKSKK